MPAVGRCAVAPVNRGREVASIGGDRVGVGECRRPGSAEQRGAELWNGEDAASVVLTVGWVGEAVSGRVGDDRRPGDDGRVEPPASVTVTVSRMYPPRRRYADALIVKTTPSGDAVQRQVRGRQGLEGRAVTPVDNDRAGAGCESATVAHLVGVGEGPEQRAACRSGRAPLDARDRRCRWSWSAGRRAR